MSSAAATGYADHVAVSGSADGSIVDGFGRTVYLTQVTVTVDGVTVATIPASGTTTSFAVNAPGLWPAGRTVPWFVDAAYQTADHAEGSSVRFASDTVTIPSVAPNQPAWQTAQGSAFNVAESATLAWLYSGVNYGDYQGAFDIRFSADSGTSWTSWTNVTGNTPSYAITGGSMAAGNWQAQVRTYNAQGTGPGPASTSLLFTLATAPARPTLTPTDSTALGSPSVSLPISCTDSFKAYRYTAVADDGTVLASTTQTGTSGTVDIAGLINGQHVFVTVAVQGNNGVWSDDADYRYAISYVPPPTPQRTYFGPGDADANGDVTTLLVTWYTPDPADGVPASVSTLVEYSLDGGTTVAHNAPGAAVSGLDVYVTPAFNTDYWVRLTATAADGATSTTGWTA